MRYREDPTPLGPVFLALLARMQKAAAAGESVLVFGPSGCGKELLLRAYLTAAKERTGQIVNCAAFAPGVLDSELFGHVRGAFTGAQTDKKGLVADRGIIGLDELGDASPDFQVRLLRVMESGEYRPVGASEVKQSKATFVAASNKVEALRRDLVWRFDVRVEIPPLFRRRDDLIAIFLAEARQRGIKAITDRCVRFLLGEYRWPGNVREVRFLLREAAWGCGEKVLDIPHLPTAPKGTATATTRARDWKLDDQFAERARKAFARDDQFTIEGLARNRYDLLASSVPELSETEFRRTLVNRMFEMGESMKGIESRLGASFTEVASTASSPKEAAREAKKAWFASRLHDGKTAVQIAAEMGCTEQNVRGHLRELGLRPDKPKP